MMKTNLYLSVLTSSSLGWPVWGSKKAKVLTLNLLTWEWEVVFPCLSTGNEPLMLSKGFGQLFRKKKKKWALIYFFLIAVVLNSPIVEKQPHRVSGHGVGEAVLHLQGEAGVRGRRSDGNFDVRHLTQRQRQWKLVFGEKGRERRIWEMTSKYKWFQICCQDRWCRASWSSPLAILICSLRTPCATTGGGFVTAYRERNLAARWRSDAAYSHCTWRL